MVVHELLEDLAVEPSGGDGYRGAVPRRNLPRMFGGQILGQALMAAAATCEPERPPHSLHCSFLRPGDPAVPVDFAVVRLRESRAFSTRRVDALQRGALIATAVVSFHVREVSLGYRRATSDDPLGPEALPTLAERLTAAGGSVPAWWSDPLPFDIRFLREPAALMGATAYPDARQQYWVRTIEALPAQPEVHAAVLAYASDLNLLDAALLPDGASWYGDRRVFGASIDHAMWFHGDLRADNWLLCTQSTEIVHRARALCEARYRELGGELVASAVQEGLVRRPE